MKSLAHTAQDYFDTLVPERREVLLRLRKLIMNIWPSMVEDMDREMPTYHLDGRTFCALASHKEYMSLYIFPYDLLDAFKKDLLIHRYGRSCLRFKQLDEDTLDLYERVIKYVGSQMHQSELVAIRHHRSRTRVAS